MFSNCFFSIDILLKENVNRYLRFIFDVPAILKNWAAKRMHFTEKVFSYIFLGKLPYNGIAGRPRYE